MDRVLVNGLQYSENGAGISRYSHKISENILKECNGIDILCREEMRKNLCENSHIISVNIKKNKSSDRIIKEQLKLLGTYKNYSLVHCLDYAIPVLYKGKTIATIHDMAMHTMKDKYTKGQVLTKNILLDYTVKNADKLICISEFTKKELLNYYPDIDNSRIEVVYNGFEYQEILLDEQTISQTLNKFNIKKEYLLFVGTLSPHKNIERIIEAFNEIKKQGYNYELVICGKKGWLYEDIFKKVKQLNIEKEVIFTDYVTDEELEVLYKKAKLFVFPSLYEGFGFPPIEAMARKVPVLTSREGALPEIVGDAAIMCDAYDTSDIANKAIEVINDNKLKQKLINRGLKRVENFSWDKSIKKIKQIYEELNNTI